jgi:glutamyl-tRNA synthetase
VAPGIVVVDDALQGHFEQDVDAAVGDFVIARADGIIAYQLAVVVDDIAMGISEVVRGSDLLFSTPRQIQLHQALGAKAPNFAHVPLVVAAKDGTKLSKRDGGHTLEGLRASGAHGVALRDKLLRAHGATIALEDLL